MLRGFTLIELVMVILLLSLLAAVAIPNFIDMRADARNAATKGGLGSIRAALAIARAAIALKETPSATLPKYPTWAEMNANAFDGSHPVLSGVKIMDPANGFPANPWNSVACGGASHASARSVVEIFTVSGAISLDEYLQFGACWGACGWTYVESEGTIFASTCNNTGASFFSSTSQAVDCAKTASIETCY